MLSEEQKKDYLEEEANWEGEQEDKLEKGRTKLLADEYENFPEPPRSYSEWFNNRELIIN